MNFLRRENIYATTSGLQIASTVKEKLLFFKESVCRIRKRKLEKKRKQAWYSSWRIIHRKWLLLFQELYYKFHPFYFSLSYEETCPPTNLTQNIFNKRYFIVDSTQKNTKELTFQEFRIRYYTIFYILFLLIL